MCSRRSTSEQKLEMQTHTPVRVRLRFGTDRVVEGLALKIDGPPSQPDELPGPATEGSHSLLGRAKRGPLATAERFIRG